MQEIEHVEELRQRLAAAEELNAQLEYALESRIVIEQAKGILAERLGLGVEEAFDVLRYAARTARIRLTSSPATSWRTRGRPVRSSLRSRAVRAGAPRSCASGTRPPAKTCAS